MGLESALPEHELSSAVLVSSRNMDHTVARPITALAPSLAKFRSIVLRERDLSKFYTDTVHLAPDFFDDKDSWEGTTPKALLLKAATTEGATWQQLRDFADEIIGIRPYGATDAKPGEGPFLLKSLGRHLLRMVTEVGEQV